MFAVCAAVILSTRLLDKMARLLSSYRSFFFDSMIMFAWSHAIELASLYKTCHSRLLSLPVDQEILAVLGDLEVQFVHCLLVALEDPSVLGGLYGLVFQARQVSPSPPVGLCHL